MTDRLDPLVWRALDGDLPLEALPPALRAEAEAARRVFGATDRGPVPLSPGFDARVLAAVRARRSLARSSSRSFRRRFSSVRSRIR